MNSLKFLFFSITIALFALQSCTKDYPFQQDELQLRKAKQIEAIASYTTLEQDKVVETKEEVALEEVAEAEVVLAEVAEVKEAEVIVKEEEVAIKEAFTAELYAGQTELVGQLIVQETESTLIIGIEAKEGLEFSENHLYVGTLEEAPLRNGNPAPGKFVNKSDETTATMYYEFNKADLAFTTEDMEDSDSSGCIIIAFHAVIGDETVWSAGSEFSGRNWATYTEFCLD